MFKKPFNQKVGETRQCKTCGKEFHTMRPVWRCKPCINEYVRNYNKSNYQSGKLNTGPLRGKEHKKPYPFSTKTNEAGKRFSKIRKELNRIWNTGDRELIRQHYDKQLKEAEEFGIIDWINDIRTNQSIKEMAKRPQQKISKEYPDTRGHYEDI